MNLKMIINDKSLNNQHTETFSGKREETKRGIHWLQQGSVLQGRMACLCVSALLRQQLGCPSGFFLCASFSTLAEWTGEASTRLDVCQTNAMDGATVRLLGVKEMVIFM